MCAGRDITITSVSPDSIQVALAVASCYLMVHEINCTYCWVLGRSGTSLFFDLFKLANCSRCGVVPGDRQVPGDQLHALSPLSSKHFGRRPFGGNTSVLARGIQVRSVLPPLSGSISGRCSRSWRRWDSGSQRKPTARKEAPPQARKPQNVPARPTVPHAWFQELRIQYIHVTSRDPSIEVFCF